MVAWSSRTVGNKIFENAKKEQVLKKAWSWVKYSSYLASYFYTCIWLYFAVFEIQRGLIYSIFTVSHWDGSNSTCPITHQESSEYRALRLWCFSFVAQWNIWAFFNQTWQAWKKVLESFWRGKLFMVVVEWSGRRVANKRGGGSIAITITIVNVANACENINDDDALFLCRL